MDGEREGDKCVTTRVARLVLTLGTGVGQSWYAASTWHTGWAVDPWEKAPYAVVRISPD